MKPTRGTSSPEVPRDLGDHELQNYGDKITELQLRNYGDSEPESAKFVILLWKMASLAVLARDD